MPNGGKKTLDFSSFDNAVKEESKSLDFSAFDNAVKKKGSAATTSAAPSSTAPSDLASQLGARINQAIPDNGQTQQPSTGLKNGNVFGQRSKTALTQDQIEKKQAAEDLFVPRNTISAPNGVKLPLLNTYHGSPQLHNQVIDELQQYINSGNIDSDVIETTAKFTGKTPEAVNAYLQGDSTTGNAFDVVDTMKKNATKLNDIIAQGNSEFGLQGNPNEILGNAELTSKYLDDYQTKLAQSNPLEILANNMRQQGRDAEANNFAPADVAALLESNPALKASMDKYQSQLQNLDDVIIPLKKHIIEQSAAEGYAKAEPRDVTANKIAKRLNPIQYKNAQEALTTIPDVSNPFAAIGVLADVIKGDSDNKTNMLNSVIGQADVELNNSYKKISEDKAALAHLTNDDNLMNEAKLINAKYDKNILDKYPALQMADMANEVSKDIATAAGQLEGTDTDSYRLKLQGASQADIIAVMQKKGWFEDPKRKALAMQIANNPDMVKDASVFGGVTDSFLQPFKDLGLSLADVSGARTFKDRLADKFQGELFPKEFSDEETKSTFSILGHDFHARHIANGISNLSGITVGSILTEGLGEAAGLSATTAQRLGAYTTFAIPSIDANLKDSYNFIDNDAQRAAYVTMGAIINGEGGNLLNLGKISRVPGLKEDFAALAKNLTEKNLTEDATKELLDKAGNKYVDFVKKYGKVAGQGLKNTGEGAATMAYFTFANEYNKLLNGDPNTKAEDLLPHAAGAFMDGVFTMLPFGFVRAVGETQNNPNSTYKETINKLSVMPDAAEDAFKLNAKSAEDFNYKMSVVNTARAAKNALDATEKETGISLDPGQRSVYVANKTIEASLRDKAAKTTDKDDKEKLEAQADELNTQSTKTLDGLKFSPTLEPLYDLYDAEKRYNKAYDDFHNGNVKDDAELLAAKNNYEKLQYKYFENGGKEPEVKQPEEKTFTDFDKTLFYEGKLTALGEEVKDRIAKGEDITILTSRDDTPENKDFISKTLGIPTENIKAGLDAQGKAAELTAYNGKKVFYDDNPDNVAAAQQTDARVVDTGIETIEARIPELFKELKDTGNADEYLNPENKERSLEEIQQQALSAPKGIRAKVGENLTVELIARNPTEDIHKAIDAWIQKVAGEEVTNQEQKDADGHIRLLEKGLEKKAEMHQDIAEKAKPAEATTPTVKDVVSEHNDKLSDLDNRAKALGLSDVSNIKQLNTQYATKISNGEAVPKGVKELLDEYGQHQNKVASLTDENEIVKLNEDNFNKWAKVNSVDKNDKTGSINRIEDLDKAASRVRILNARGMGKEAASELKDLKNSTKKTNWTLEDYKKNVDEEGTQKDVDELNDSNKEFNDKLKTAIEAAQESKPTTQKEETTFADKVRKVTPALKNASDEDALQYAKETATDNPTKFVKDFGQENFDNTVKDVSTSELQKKADFLKENMPEDKGGEVLDKIIADRGQSKEEPAAETPPPKEPIDEAQKAADAENEKFSSVRKEKLKEDIKGAKKIFEQRVPKTWNEVYDSALKNVQEMYPNKSLYEAMKSRVTDFLLRLNNGELFNPTSEDIAVFNVLKAETLKRIDDTEGQNSDNSIVRQAALMELDNYDKDLLDIAKVTNPNGEAGRAFGMLQSEVNTDSGLKIRRMELMKANGGEKLSEVDEAFVKEQWDKEKDLMKQENEARTQQMQDDFDAKIADLQKEYEDKIKNAKIGKPETKREKTLSQSGKDLADKIRKLKTQKGDTALDITLGLKNLAVEAVAQLVEKGAKLAEAIKNVLTDEKYKGLSEDDLTNHILNGIDRQENKEISFDALRDFAKDNDVTDITPDMVSKNLIRDVVNSHLGEVEPKDILDESLKAIKEILPNATKEKLIEAYLKENEFKQPTKEAVEGGLAEAKKQLETIAKTTEDIADLQQLKEVRQRSFPSEREKSEAEQELLDKKAELIKERKDREASIREENDKLESERNRQLQKVKDLQDKKEKLENGIREKKVQRVSEKDVPEIEALKEQVKEADKNLREAESFFKKIKDDLAKRTDKLQEIEAGIKRAEGGYDQIKTFKDNPEKSIDATLEAKQKELKNSIKNNATDEQQQRKALENAIKNEKQKIKDFTQRIKEGNYEEDKPPIKLKKQTAELIRLAKQRSIIEETFRKKQKELREKNKSGWERAADTARSTYVALLIGNPVTLAKVATMSALRPTSEAATKLTFGKVFDTFFPGISKAAKLGGESSSMRSIRTGFEAFFRQMGDRQMEDKYENANEKFDAAQKAYNDYKNSDNPDRAKLKQLENKRNDALIKVQGSFIYKFIGGSSLKDALSALVNRSNEIEKQFGKVEGETIKDGNWLDKANYIMGFIGRSHSAAKTFSGRFSFAAGFMARLEGAVESGQDISSPDKVLEIAHESYLDWERGKYQQDNAITTWWNNKFKDSKNETTVGKAGDALLKADVAITRVPVNILHEQIMEYTLGTFRALKAAAKVNKEVSSQLKNEGFNPESPEFKDALKERIEQMDSKQAATIARCFRKGGLGVGLYAFALISGAIHFGIFPHLGQKKKKPENELAPGELNPGDIMVGHTRFNETVAKITEHIPVFWPTFMGLGLAQAYHDEIAKGKTTTQAVATSLYTHLKIVESNIPQFKLVQPLQEDVAKTVKKRATEMGLVEPPTIGKDKIKNYKDKGRAITDEEYSNFKDKKEEEISKQIERLKAGKLPENVVRDEKTGKIMTKKFADMTFQESRKAITSIKTKATTKVKKEMFGEEDESSKEKKAELKEAKAEVNE